MHEFNPTETVQMNVRLRHGKAIAARAIAKAHNESLSTYVDRLLAQDVANEHELLLQSYDDDLDRIQKNREAVLRELSQEA